MRSFLKRLMQCLFVWGRPKAQGYLEDAQIILVLAASDCMGDRPSKTNIALADLAEKYHDQLEIPIFPQAEVWRILLERGIRSIATTEFYGTGKIDLFSEDYAGSHGIVKLQAELCRQHGWDRVLVIAAYPYAYRAIWLCEELGDLEVVVPADLPKMQLERDYSQKRWGRAITAYPYEFAVRLWSLAKGYI